MLFLPKGREKVVFPITLAGFSILLQWTPCSHCDAFLELGEAIDLSPNLVESLGSFVCCLYGLESEADVNSAMYTLFKESTAKKIYHQAKILCRSTSSVQITSVSFDGDVARHLSMPQALWNVVG